MSVNLYYSWRLGRKNVSVIRNSEVSVVQRLLYSMELQSGLGKVSVIREVSALQRCPLREVPLYNLQ